MECAEEPVVLLVRGLSGDVVLSTTLPGAETVDTVKHLIQASRDVPTPVYCQQLVLAERVLDEYELLRDLGTNLQLTLLILQYDSSAGEAMLRAATLGDAGRVLEALRGRADPNFSRDGSTALRTAATAGFDKVVDTLCRCGADVNQASSEGLTALFAAVQQRRLQVIRRLCLAKADANRATARGTTPLLMAARQGHEDVVAILCEVGGARVNEPGPDGVTPLVAAMEAASFGAVQRLCEARALADSQVKRGASPPLLLSIQKGFATPNLVCLLHAASADVDGRAQGGLCADTVTPLVAALQSSNTEVACSLCDLGADPNFEAAGFTPLCVAAEAGDELGVHRLLASRAEPEKSCIEFGATPLILAAAAGHELIVEMLCAAGADPCKPNESDEETPLIAAVRNGEEMTVRILLEANALANGAIRDGSTPLLIAVQSQRIDIVSCLLDNAADVNRATAEGVTPWMVAQQSGCRELCRVVDEMRRFDPKLRDFLRKARPDWTKTELLQAQEKLLKVQVESVPDLLLMLRVRGLESLNNRLKTVDQGGFTQRTMEALHELADQIDRPY